MNIKQWYKNSLKDDRIHYDKKIALLSAVSLTGVIVSLGKDRKFSKLPFIMADSALIVDTLVELIFNIKENERRKNK